MIDRMPRGRTPTVSDTEVIEAAKQIDDPVFKTPEVAERLDVGEQTVRNRLKELTDDNIIQYKTAGSAKVYWFVGF